MSSLDFHTELSFYSLYVYLKMELAHTTNDNLFGLFVDVYFECWILTLEFI